MASFFNRDWMWLNTLLHETSEALYSHVWVIDWATNDHDHDPIFTR